jgi:hypothetical protein
LAKIVQKGAGRRICGRTRLEKGGGGCRLIRAVRGAIIAGSRRIVRKNAGRVPMRRG